MPYQKAIGDYVDNMGGVETASQLPSYYQGDHKSVNRLFYSSMKICMMNSWMNYCDMVVCSEIYFWSAKNQ
jgi:hypothetical protein